MVTGGTRAHRVLDEHDVVRTLVRVARGRLDAIVGRDPAQDDRPHPPAAELQVELGSVERSPLALLHDDVARFGPQLRHDVGEPGRHVAPRHDRVGDRVQAVGTVTTRHDMDEDNGRAERPEAPGEKRRVGDDRIGGMRFGLHRRDAPLQVDEDERRGRRIESVHAHVCLRSPSLWSPSRMCTFTRRWATRARCPRLADPGRASSAGGAGSRSTRTWPPPSTPRRRG